MSERSLADRLSGADVETLREMMREAEAYLNAQLTAAIGADQRAYTFAGFGSAAAVVLVGAAYGIASARSPDIPMAILATVVAGFLIAGAMLAIHSARSVDFEYSGNQPGHWVEDVEERKSLQRSLAEQCEHYDLMIGKNTKTISDNSRVFQRSTYIAQIGLGVGAAGFVLWLAARLFC